MWDADVDVMVRKGEALAAYARGGTLSVRQTVAKTKIY